MDYAEKFLFVLNLHIAMSHIVSQKKVLLIVGRLMEVLTDSLDSYIFMF